MFEDLSCLLATSNSCEGVDIPQRAYGEGYCRGAEVVWGGIAEDMKAISEPLSLRPQWCRGSADATRGRSQSRAVAGDWRPRLFPLNSRRKCSALDPILLSRIVARIRFASVRQ